MGPLAKGRFGGWLLGVALMGLTLSGCSSDCPSCTEVRNAPELNLLAFQLCVSQVPNPDLSEGACGDVDGTYVVVSR